MTTVSGQHLGPQRRRQLVVAIEIDIAADADVLDPDKLRDVIEVIDHILDGDGLVAAHQLPNPADTHNAAACRHLLDQEVTLVSRMGIQRLAIRVREQHRTPRKLAALERRLGAAVGYIDSHANLVHDRDHLASVFSKAGVRYFVSATDGIVIVVSELREPLAKTAEEADVFELLKVVGALKAEQNADSLSRLKSVDIGH